MVDSAKRQPGVSKRPKMVSMPKNIENAFPVRSFGGFLKEPIEEEEDPWGEMGEKAVPEEVKIPTESIEEEVEVEESENYTEVEEEISEMVFEEVKKESMSESVTQTESIALVATNKITKVIDFSPSFSAI